MDIRFDGKRALVTGAGKGIGKGIAKALFAGGADTYALSRTQDDLDKLEAECPGMHTVCVDLSDWETTKKAVEQIGPIDLLVNNAAIISATPMLGIEEMTINKIFDVNLNAVMNVSQVVAKGMIEKGNGGSIVNISSRSSTRTGIRGYVAYGASKAALDQMMRVMAGEFGPHQIRINCVNPTLVMTDMGINLCSDPAAFANNIPLRRLAVVKDVVYPVLFLLSDKADMITGVTLLIDGGTAVM